MSVKTFHNHYLVNKEIEYGACGRTYLVEDINHQTRPNFVLQQLEPNYGSCRSPLEKELLWQESKKSFDQSMGKLQKISRYSDSIPLITDYFTENNQLFVVQEKLDGTALSGKLQPGMRWSQQDTIQLLITILQALSFCHQEGVIHQDLKPENVWINNSGKLSFINFGALQEINQLSISQPRTVSRAVIGTEGYMPIEQLAGSPVLASDIHAVGAIGIQAITGLAPQAIVFDYDRGIPSWQKTPGCYFTAAFAQVLNRMLADLPDDRYPNAAAALAALEAIAVPVTSSTSSENIISSTFTFEIAQLRYVPEQQGAQISGWLIEEMSGWLGIEEKSEKPANRWQIKKYPGTAQLFTEELGNGIQLEMVYIAGGDFIMGAADYELESSDHERPQHTVNISDFYMSRYPITQEQYLAMMGTNPAFREGAKLPIENVSWHDARQFCQELSVRTGRPYKIPSEAQWEFACRAGTTTPFSFGEIITADVANYNGNYPYADAPRGHYRKETTVVDHFSPNNFGLSDMHGNVWEWCEDHWFSNYEHTPTNGEPAIKLNSDVNSPRVLRGGSWFRNSIVCRSAARHRYNADFQFNDIGFRVVQAI